MRAPLQDIMFGSGRVLVWFSYGAASAVAGKKAIEKYGDRTILVNCDTTKNEHEDNARFRADCERWFGRKVHLIKSEVFDTIEEVFEKTGYMSGPAGARCTTEVKKLPRLRYQLPGDIHVFGFTADEKDRVSDFEMNNPELFLDWVLVDAGITKQDCYRIIQEAGIALPAMYLLGYKNNNCKGCVKASSPGYWNKVSEDFPEVFAIRAKQSRELGCRLVKLKGERIFLDELPLGNGLYKYKRENISCGPECGGHKL